MNKLSLFLVIFSGLSTMAFSQEVAVNEQCHLECEIADNGRDSDSLRDYLKSVRQRDREQQNQQESPYDDR